MALGWAAVAAAAIFIIVYFFIVTEKMHRTTAALLGAAAVLLCGLVEQEEAVHYIDFNTIGLLVGMMIIVNITAQRRLRVSGSVGGPCSQETFLDFDRAGCSDCCAVCFT